MKRTKLTMKLRRSVMDFVSSRLDLADLREAENKAVVAVRGAFEAWLTATLPPEDLVVLRKYQVTLEATHLSVYAVEGKFLPDGRGRGGDHVEAELHHPVTVLRSWVRWSHPQGNPCVVVDLSNSGYDVTALESTVNEWLAAVFLHRSARRSYMADVEAFLAASNTLESVVEVLPVVSEMPIPGLEPQPSGLDEGVKSRLSAAFQTVTTTTGDV